MTNQIQQANLLKALHIKGNPLILFNTWDAGSSKIAEKIGSKVIATSSFAVAASHGYDDGEKLPLTLALDNIQRIVADTTLPVTLDFESGYAKNPDELKNNIVRVIKTGVAGINFEDQAIGTDTLYSIEEQCSRIQAIREIASSMSISLFINARTDIFLKSSAVHHDDNLLQRAIERAISYAQAGANGFFVPGLQDEKLIKKLCDRSPLPINIMVDFEKINPKNLEELGVARISYGLYPYLKMMGMIENLGCNIFSNLALS